VQVGRLIDSRRDFTKPTKKPNAEYDPQTWLYDTLKHQFRYYKGPVTTRKARNLDTMVQERLGDRSISQAWLKMYEIITDCELIPRNQKGAFRSFHLCEAPGTFINALNNYIHTKTSYTDFKWVAQSLHPRIADIKDTYGLIKRHPSRWDWGSDGTGDVTQVKNIRHYMKQAREMGNINLMTSDCGLPMGKPKYELVAFASYVAILAILPQGGTMIYKILSPIDLPLIWNLIYVTYTNFKELTFFKPVQNSQSREFYIIAKDYLGTDAKVIDKLLDIISRWSRLESSGYKAPWLDELDLFADKYPEEFVVQVLSISERLAQNYVNSIERIIYYVDNHDVIGDEYTRHIEKYIKEKNEDWIERYKPRKLENKWVL
jgi:cap2 methyltransferase